MKKTAVEWLVKEFNLEEFRATIDFAKSKEKEQITEAFKKGVSYWNGDEWKLIDIEGYYNETYKK